MLLPCHNWRQCVRISVVRCVCVFGSCSRSLMWLRSSMGGSRGGKPESGCPIASMSQAPLESAGRVDNHHLVRVLGPEQKNGHRHPTGFIPSSSSQHPGRSGGSHTFCPRRHHCADVFSSRAMFVCACVTGGARPRRGLWDTMQPVGAVLSWQLGSVRVVSARVIGQPWTRRGRVVAVQVDYDCQRQ